MTRACTSSRFSAFVSVFVGVTVFAQPEKVDFRRDVLPILRQNCVGCHGPSKQMNSLRLDRRSRALRGGTQTVLVPGNSASSRLYHRLIGQQVRQPDAAERPAAARPGRHDQNLDRSGRRVARRSRERIRAAADRSGREARDRPAAHGRPGRLQRGRCRETGAPQCARRRRFDAVHVCGDLRRRGVAEAAAREGRRSERAQRRERDSTRLRRMLVGKNPRARRSRRRRQRALRRWPDAVVHRGGHSRQHRDRPAAPRSRRVCQSDEPLVRRFHSAAERDRSARLRNREAARRTRRRHQSRRFSGARVRGCSVPEVPRPHRRRLRTEGVFAGARHQRGERRCGRDKAAAGSRRRRQRDGSEWTHGAHHGDRRRSRAAGPGDAAARARREARPENRVRVDGARLREAPWRHADRRPSREGRRAGHRRVEAAFLDVRQEQHGSGRGAAESAAPAEGRREFPAEDRLYLVPQRQLHGDGGSVGAQERFPRR